MSLNVAGISRGSKNFRGFRGESGTSPIFFECKALSVFPLGDVLRSSIRNFRPSFGDSGGATNFLDCLGEPGNFRVSLGEAGGVGNFLLGLGKSVVSGNFLFNRGDSSPVGYFLESFGEPGTLYSDFCWDSAVGNFLVKDGEGDLAGNVTLLLPVCCDCCFQISFSVVGEDGTGNLRWVVGEEGSFRLRVGDGGGSPPVALAIVSLLGLGGGTGLTFRFRIGEGGDVNFLLLTSVCFLLLPAAGTGDAVLLSKEGDGERRARVGEGGV